MEDLISQTQNQVIDFGESWRKASAHVNHEIQYALYPHGFREKPQAQSTDRN